MKMQPSKEAKQLLKEDFNWGDFAVIVACVLGVIALWALDKHLEEKVKVQPTQYKGT